MNQRFLRDFAMDAPNDFYGRTAIGVRGRYERFHADVENAIVHSVGVFPTIKFLHVFTLLAFPENSTFDAQTPIGKIRENAFRSSIFQKESIGQQLLGKIAPFLSVHQHQNAVDVGLSRLL